MEIGGKKYEILPGTAVPDLKTILGAASDFSTPGVESVEIKGMAKRHSLAETETKATLTNPEEELKRLQELGDEVSENETRAAEESRRKMEEIKNKAVMAPESLSALRQRATNDDNISEERKAELERVRKEQEEKAAEEEAKRLAREERRQMQKQALLDSRAKAEAAKKEASQVNHTADASDDKTADEVIEPVAGEAESEAVTEIKDAVEEVEAIVTEEAEVTVVEDSTKSITDESDDSDSSEDSDGNTDSGIASSDETMDDFSEFL